MSTSFEEAASWIRNGRIQDLASFLQDTSNYGHFDINAQEENTGNTLLHIACQNGSKNIVKTCLRNGANMNCVNAKGRTPLHHCIMYGFHTLAEYFVSKGANDTITDMEGYKCYEAALSRAV